MKRRVLTQREVDVEPFRVWNAYVNLLAMESYLDLAPVQRPAHLVFWYEHEVQNGGHMQFFENRSAQHLPETVEALGLLGASCQQQVLTDAIGMYDSGARAKCATIEQFCAAALEGEFSVVDTRFHSCSQSLQECLEAYLRKHQESFVVIK